MGFREDAPPGFAQDFVVTLHAHFQLLLVGDAVESPTAGHLADISESRTVSLDIILTSTVSVL